MAAERQTSAQRIPDVDPKSAAGVALTNAVQAKLRQFLGADYVDCSLAQVGSSGRLRCAAWQQWFLVLHVWWRWGTRVSHQEVRKYRKVVPAPIGCQYPRGGTRGAGCARGLWVLCAPRHVRYAC